MDSQELESPPPTKVSHLKLVLSQTLTTDEVVNYRYPGSGTESDPYVVDWIPNDPRNPLRMGNGMKWFITNIMAFGTLSVAFSSTAFSGALPQIQLDLGASDELAIASISLFVLGFSIAPMTWAPMSELYGRQVMYISMFALLTIFGGASIASQNVGTLLVLRFFAGVFGSSSIVNSAGVVSDIFEAKQRGLAMMVYSSAPFLGPTLGPITGGFLAQAAGWRWVDGMTVIFSGVLFILGTVIVPETYTPYLLARRAKKLSRMTGQVYVSKLVVGKPKKSASETFKTALFRPWIFLFVEPIIFFLSIYVSIVYGTLYLVFTAFPIVFEGERHWSQGVSGLSYLGMMIGQIISMFFYVFMEVRYQKKIAKNPTKVSPEGRLDPALIGAVCLPIGLFWFAWTTYSSIHWIVCLLGIAIFGFGQVLLFISLVNYVVDAYTIFAASALAANAIIRGLFAAAFPLFTTQMYNNLGVQWASSIPAFLSLACAPFPFIFYKYGPAIRMHSKYAKEAKSIADKIFEQKKASAEKPTQLDGDSSPETASSDRGSRDDVMQKA